MKKNQKFMFLYKIFGGGAVRALLRSLANYPYYIITFVKLKAFHRNEKIKRMKFEIQDLYPCLFDRTSTTGFDKHYLFHTAWAVRKVAQIQPPIHFDFSSSLYFCALLSAFHRVKFFDYRPAELNLTNLESSSADLTKLPFADNSVYSLSCMHVVEHIGLGRYGDPLDYDGDLKAINELKRVTSIGGHLLFVVPVGKNRIAFNAHRVYSFSYVVDLFQDFELVEFSLVKDDSLGGNFISNATSVESDEQSYGCGMFWFRKKSL